MKTDNPLPHMIQAPGYEMPRRSRIDLHTPVEKDLRAAFVAIESLGADPLLTHAVNLIEKAHNLVADWLEGKTGDYVDGKIVVKE